MVRWERGGYEVESWRLYRVDRRTWADAGLVSRVNSVTVNRSYGDEDRTIERGDLSLDKSVRESFDEGYYRVAMTARQGGASDRVDVATLLCSSVSEDVNRGVSDAKVTGRSVLFPASTADMTIGAYAPAGVDGAQWAAGMLRSAINAPVIVTGSFTLDDHVVFDTGTKVLDAVWKVLEAGGFILQIDGRGRVYVTQKPTKPSLDLDLAHARLLQPAVGIELDFSEVPNAYTAIDGDQIETVINDLVGSPTSIPARGWRYDMTDTSPVRVNGETLHAYCGRMLEERSTVLDARNYTREWWPDVLPGNVVRGSIASIGMVGDFRVMSQQIACGVGITVQERSAMEVRAWQRT